MIKMQSQNKKEAFNPFDSTFNLKQDVITLGIILVVCFIQSLTLSAFYTPNHFLSGGITGLSLLFDYLFDLPRWVTLIALNIPVLIIGLKPLKTKAVVFSAIATISYSIFFEIPFVANFRIGLGSDSALLSAIVGSAIFGVTSAPVVKRGASLGGIDILALILSRKYSIQMGTICIAFNFVIMTVLGFFYGTQIALLSMLAMFVSNTAFNFALRGVNHNNSVFIISEKWEEIAPHVMADMHRGVTFLYGEGAYTGQPRRIVYCIVKTTELTKLKAIVKMHDNNALFSIIETKDVVGRGFGALN